MTDAELEATFDQVLALFRYTQGALSSDPLSDFSAYTVHRQGRLGGFLYSTVCEAAAAQQVGFVGYGEAHARQAEAGCVR